MFHISNVYISHSSFLIVALSMEYNIAQMSAAASLSDTYSGGPIFDDFLA